MGNLFGDAVPDEANAFPAAMDAWSRGYIGYPIGENDEGRPNGELDRTDNLAYQNWKKRSLLYSVDQARGAAFSGIQGKPWFKSVGWSGVEVISILPYLDNAQQNILDMIEYIMEGDFGIDGEDLGSNWWKPSKDDTVTIDTPVLNPLTDLTVGVPVVPPDVPLEMFRPHDSPLIVNWTPTTVTSTDWTPDDVMEILREFAQSMIQDGEIEPIVDKYRAAIVDDYTRANHRNAGLMFFTGAANTSPATLAAWRQNEELERQVAAFRAELLNRMYPDANSIVGVFQAMANDSARIDNTNLQVNAQILQANIARMDGYLETAATRAANNLQAHITDSQLETQQNIAMYTTEYEADVRLILAGLEARVRIGSITDTLKIEVAKMLMTLHQSLANMNQQRASVATELRREYQSNRLKMHMWRIELSETLMNASTIPLGIPMQPPRPSEFETRVSAGIQTFVNVAGAVAPSGSIPLAVGLGLVGAAATMFMPR